MRLQTTFALAALLMSSASIAAEPLNIPLFLQLGVAVRGDIGHVTFPRVGGGESTADVLLGSLFEKHTRDKAAQVFGMIPQPIVASVAGQFGSAFQCGAEPAAKAVCSELVVQDGSEDQTHTQEAIKSMMAQGHAAVYWMRFWIEPEKSGLQLRAFVERFPPAVTGRTVVNPSVFFNYHAVPSAAALAAATAAKDADIGQWLLEHYWFDGNPTPFEVTLLPAFKEFREMMAYAIDTHLFDSPAGYNKKVNAMPQLRTYKNQGIGCNGFFICHSWVIQIVDERVRAFTELEDDPVNFEMLSTPVLRISSESTH